MTNESFFAGVKITNSSELDHVPFSEILANESLLAFFVNEKPDEFIKADNEEQLKESLETALDGRADDFLSSAKVEFSEDSQKQEMIAMIKEELPVLLQFSDEKADWPEIYKAFNFKDMPKLPESESTRLFLRDKLMALLDIDSEIFKDSFFYYDSLKRQGQPLRKADIISVYKKAKALTDIQGSMRKVKKVFDELVLERRKSL